MGLNTGGPYAACAIVNGYFSSQEPHTERKDYSADPSTVFQFWYNDVQEAIVNHNVIKSLQCVGKKLGCYFSSNQEMFRL